MKSYLLKILGELNKVVKYCKIMKKNMFLAALLAVTFLFTVPMACTNNDNAENTAANESSTVEPTLPTEEMTTEEEVIAYETNAPEEIVAPVETEQPKKKQDVKKPTPTPTAPKIVAPAKPTSAPTVDAAPSKVDAAPKTEAAPKITKIPLKKPATRPAVEAAPTTQEFSHAAWDNLLKKYVNSAGAVDYAGFKKDKAILANYIQSLATVNISGMSKNEQLAFWINAYNANTVYLIAQNYPMTSIMDLYGGNVWKVLKLKVAGSSLTLNDIESEKLIKGLGEPRVHFAVNCAAASCPPLLNRAWSAATMNADLTNRTSTFINNRKYNTISPKAASLSKIFEWYASDFGDIKTFINKYSLAKINDKTKISYNEYNWKLNN